LDQKKHDWSGDIRVYGYGFRMHLTEDIARVCPGIDLKSSYVQTLYPAGTDSRALRVFS
jgi:hypothetical protein